MSIKRERVYEERPLADLLGKPAFLKSEDGNDYATLRAAIERKIDPQDIFDEMRVKDITDKVWEENRLKRQQTALIQGALSQSLASLFAPLYGENLETALETARNYYSGDPEKVRQVQKEIDQLGITPEQIEASAMHIRAPGLQMLDRMILNREIVRNRLIKDHERRQRKANKAKQRVGINDN